MSAPDEFCLSRTIQMFALLLLLLLLLRSVDGDVLGWLETTVTTQLLK